MDQRVCLPEELLGVNKKINGVSSRFISSQSGWYRIAKLDEVDCAGFFFATDKFENIPGPSYIIAVCKEHVWMNAKLIFKNTSSDLGAPRITKVRVSTVGTSLYLEVYQSTDNAGYVSCGFIGNAVSPVDTLDEGTPSLETVIEL